MKKTLLILHFAFSIIHSFASPSGVWLPVHSYEKSTSPLHVREFSNMPDGRFAAEREWTFPASYTGHRSVCWLPGASTNMAFYAWVGSDNYTPGDPFGFTPAASSNNTQAIALTRTSTITPRIKLWEAGSSDRIVRYGLDQPTNTTTATLPQSDVVRVRVSRLSADEWEMWEMGLDYRVVLDRTFSAESRDYIHEGDFVVSNEFDIGWSSMNEVISLRRYQSSFLVTNVAYAIVFGHGELDRTALNPYNEMTCHPLLVTRRFEAEQTPPTAVGYDATLRTFRWRIDNEDPWASKYGTTYTAFKVQAYGSTTNDVVCDTGYRRMPPVGADGTFQWRAPTTWTNALQSATSWRVFCYNAKFHEENSRYLRQVGWTVNFGSALTPINN